MHALTYFNCSRSVPLELSSCYGSAVYTSVKCPVQQLTASSGARCPSEAALTEEDRGEYQCHECLGLNAVNKSFIHGANFDSKFGRQIKIAVRTQAVGSADLLLFIQTKNNGAENQDLSRRMILLKIGANQEEGAMTFAATGMFSTLINISPRGTLK
jgi:hypothetical protein